MPARAAAPAAYYGALARYAFDAWTGAAYVSSVSRSDAGAAKEAERLERSSALDASRANGVWRARHHAALDFLFAARRSGDLRMLASAHRALAETLAMGPRSGSDRALRHALASIAAAEQRDSSLDLGLGHTAAAAVLARSARYRDAMTHLVKAEVLLGGSEGAHEEPIRRARELLFEACRALGQLDDALAHAFALLAAAERAGVPTESAAASWRVAEMLALKGDTERAGELLAKAFALAPEAVGAPDRYMLCFVRGAVAQLGGDLRGARSEHERALAIDEDGALSGTMPYDAGIAWAGTVLRDPVIRATLEQRDTIELLERASRIVEGRLRSDRAHVYVLAASLSERARLRALYGQARSAARDLDRAELLARDAPLHRAAIVETRADIERSHNVTSAAALYESASSLFGDAHARADLTRIEAKLSDLGVRSSGARQRPVQESDVKLDALLAVSLAAVTSLDPADQARGALDELVRVFGAERALLFVVDAAGERLVLTGARDEQGRDLPDDVQYSTTVVEKVRVTKAPLVVTGTQEGALLGSESAVIYNLRSIMASPLLVRDRVVGVVYLDNRVEKGIRTQTDVMVLQAIANHMAIAIEGARTARLELERNALESAKALMTKDLELTSAVQKLFLPGDWASSKGGVELHAAYRPASRCGGDWWWADAHPDGSVTILVGDVTGHGPAPAVITAAIATAYTLLRETYPDRPLDWVLGELNTELLSLSGGTYMMSISAVTIDPRQRSLRCLSAGAPPLLAISSKGAIKPLIVPGTPLGSQILSLGELREPLGEGDRVLIFTDGVSELELPGGKQLGLRRLTKLASGLVEGSVTDAVARLVVELDRLRQETEQQDDMTLVLAGIRA